MTLLFVFSSAVVSTRLVETHRLRPPVVSGGSSEPSSLIGRLARNFAPVPDFTSRCLTYHVDNSMRCDVAIVAATNRARTAEHVGQLNLNIRDFRRLSAPEQLFVLVDLERTARGLPPFSVLTSSLDAIATAGAIAGVDPALSSADPQVGGQAVSTWGSNWAGSTIDALASNYFWMYSDGPNGINVTCTSPSSPGCWGHRENILGAYPYPGSQCPVGQPAVLAMGAALRPEGADAAPSISELLVATCGSAPGQTVMTWTRAKVLAGVS